MTDDMVAISCTVNERQHDLVVTAGETLLDSLRNRLLLTGTKEGCMEGECGACTVLVDGLPVDSCILASASLDGCAVRTVEGLGDRESLSHLQQAFVDTAAVQCGFCTPGMLMTLTALVEHVPSPTPDEVRSALSGNLCRCTGYQQIVDAVVAATGDRA